MEARIDVNVESVSHRATARIVVPTRMPSRVESYSISTKPYDDPHKILIDVQLLIHEEPREPGKVYTAVMHSTIVDVDLGCLAAGKRYALRVNGKNEWVRWFEVA